MSNLLTVTQAAVIAGCHRETIAQALRSGDLHGFQRQKNGTWKTEEECVKAWGWGRACDHLGMKAAA